MKGEKESHPSPTKAGKESDTKACIVGFLFALLRCTYMEE